MSDYRNTEDTDYSNVGAAAGLSAIFVVGIMILFAPIGIVWLLWTKGGAAGRTAAKWLGGALVAVALVGIGTLAVGAVDEQNLKARIEPRIIQLQTDPAWLPAAGDERTRYLMAYQRQWSQFPLVEGPWTGSYSGNLTGQWDRGMRGFKGDVCQQDRYGLRRDPLPTVTPRTICAIDYDKGPTLTEAKALAVFATELRTRLKESECKGSLSAEIRSLCALP